MSRSAWYSNSRCTRYITGDRLWFIGYANYKRGEKEVSVFNGILAPALGFGTFRLILRLPGGRIYEVTFTGVPPMEQSLSLIIPEVSLGMTDALFLSVKLLGRVELINLCPF
jgi:hypothetical protein